MVITVEVLLLFKTVLAILGFYLYEEWNCPISVYKELGWNFDGDSSQSVNSFWSDGDILCVNHTDP